MEDVRFLILAVLLMLTCVSGYITHHIVKDHYKYLKWLEITIGLAFLFLLIILFLLFKI